MAANPETVSAEITLTEARMPIGRGSSRFDRGLAPTDRSTVERLMSRRRRG